jgi:hypothetical protein
MEHGMERSEGKSTCNAGCEAADSPCPYQQSRDEVESKRLGSLGMGREGKSNVDSRYALHNLTPPIIDYHKRSEISIFDVWMTTLLLNDNNNNLLLQASRYDPSIITQTAIILFLFSGLSNAE